MLGNKIWATNLRKPDAGANVSYQLIAIFLNSIFENHQNETKDQVLQIDLA